MNVVDSSGWLEYFANGKNAGFFAPPIEDLSRLIVPTLSLFKGSNAFSSRAASLAPSKPSR